MTAIRHAIRYVLSPPPPPSGNTADSTIILSDSTLITVDAT